jgi:hypothetical protein
MTERTLEISGKDIDLGSRYLHIKQASGSQAQANQIRSANVEPKPVVVYSNVG